MNRKFIALPLLLATIALSYGKTEGVLALAPPRPPRISCEAGKTIPCVVLANSTSDMAGIWKQYQSNPIFAAANGMGYIRYSADGTFAIADTQEHVAAVSFGNFPYGTYSFEGTSMTINVANPPPSMPECAHSVQEVRVVKMGAQMVALSFTPIEDSCKPRLTTTAQMQMYVGPTQ